MDSYGEVRRVRNEMSLGHDRCIYPTTVSGSQHSK